MVYRTNDSKSSYNGYYRKRLAGSVLSYGEKMKDYLPDQVPVNETLSHLDLSQEESGLTQEQWKSTIGIEFKVERGEYPLLRVELESGTVV
jgi:hypothetical protein